MKTLKFREPLSKLILQGEKTTTWRLFDDKDLSAGDLVSFLVSETKKEFAQAKLISVKEATLEKMTEEDWEGHDKFSSDAEMFTAFSKYYNCPVDGKTAVKVVKFELVK